MSPSLKRGQVNDHFPSQSSRFEKTKQGRQDINIELPLCFRVIYYHLLKVPSWAWKMAKYEDLQNPKRWYIHCVLGFSWAQIQYSSISYVKEKKILLILPLWPQSSQFSIDLMSSLVVMWKRTVYSTYSRFSFFPRWWTFVFLCSLAPCDKPEFLKTVKLPWLHKMPWSSQASCAMRRSKLWAHAAASGLVQPEVPLPSLRFEMSLCSVRDSCLHLGWQVTAQTLRFPE